MSTKLEVFGRCERRSRVTFGVQAWEINHGGLSWRRLGNKEGNLIGGSAEKKEIRHHLKPNES